jgi:fatty acid desaturase
LYIGQYKLTRNHQLVLRNVVVRSGKIVTSVFPLNCRWWIFNVILILQYYLVFFVLNSFRHLRYNFVSPFIFLKVIRNEFSAPMMCMLLRVSYVPPLVPYILWPSTLCIVAQYRNNWTNERDEKWISLRRYFRRTLLYSYNRPVTTSCCFDIG